MKIAINKCFGGFNVSKEAIIKLNEMGCEHLINGKVITEKHRSENRSCPHLIKVIEEMGEKADGECAKLKIIEIPDDVEFEIDDYDGMESVHEVHREWH